MSFVLIVEPEEVNASRIKTILESLELDFEYELVRTAEAAISVVEARKPDVFIGDMQMPVMNGTEFFSMIEMMSPETIRIVMTDGVNIQETVSFINECRTFKIIIKPCRVADDLLGPINTALMYKKKNEQADGQTKQIDPEQQAVEDAFAEMDKVWRENAEKLKRVQNVIEDMISSNINANSSMPEKVQERVKRWYQWMLEEYIRLVVNGSGDYKQMESAQVAFGHEPKYNCSFLMRNHSKEPMEPRCVNEIGYILRVLTGICKDLQVRYSIQAVIEQTDKAYILRVRYELTRDENGVESPQNHRVRTPEIREALRRATELAGLAFGYKYVIANKDFGCLVNMAILR